MAYCSESDLLLGNIPLPSGVDPARFIQDAADEIDSIIGFVYLTPVVAWEDADPQPDTHYVLARPVMLLLKRLNVFLATGRLILAIDSAGEDTQLHAYGLKLVSDALATLAMIRDGKIELEGAPEVMVETADSHRGPMIINGDASSAVDDFYGPNGVTPPGVLTGKRVEGFRSPLGTESETYPYFLRNPG